MKNLKFPLPEGFSAGHGRADMTPEIPILLGGGTIAEAIRDPMLTTCTAISDGETVVLLYHNDMKDTPRPFFLEAAAEIEKETGVPRTHIILNATHNHSCPHTIKLTDECLVWRKKAFQALAEAGKMAILDLAPAKVSIGKKEAPNFCFTRRYVMKDGSFKSIQSKNPCTEYAGHENDADTELRVIRFHREGKKDIILANWQMHAAHAIGVYKKTISADFPADLRNRVESEMGAYLSYHNGASGNLVMTDKMGNRIFPSHHEIGFALKDVLEEALKEGEKVNTGKIHIDVCDFPCGVQQDSEEKKAHAREWSRAPKEEKDAILEKYGLISQYECYAINTRAKMNEVEEVPLTALSFGDIAFATTPFESFDLNFKALREASPYKMTFTCAYTNSALGYMPYKEAFPHGEYEVYVSRFECGTPEKCNEKLLEMLREQKNK